MGWGSSASPAHGREISFRMLHVFEFRDGRISRENVWLDAVRSSSSSQLLDAAATATPRLLTDGDKHMYLPPTDGSSSLADL